MSTVFERRPLTQAVKAALEAVQVGVPGGSPSDTQDALVGLGTVPIGAGWGEIDPNAPGAYFVPYFVLNTLTAVPAQDSGSLANPQEDWHVPYSVMSFGVTHDQAEWIGDKGRVAIGTLKGEILLCGASNYKVQQVWTSQLGGATRIPASDPPYYAQSDAGTLWMAKRRTPPGP